MNSICLLIIIHVAATQCFVLKLGGQLKLSIALVSQWWLTWLTCLLNFDSHGPSQLTTLYHLEYLWMKWSLTCICFILVWNTAFFAKSLWVWPYMSPLLLGYKVVFLRQLELGSIFIVWLQHCFFDATAASSWKGIWNKRNNEASWNW